MAQFDAQGALDTSLLMRLFGWMAAVWHDSLLGRGLAAIGRFVARVFAGSFFGHVWYSDWPEPVHTRASVVGRLVEWLNRGFLRVAGRVSPFLLGTWETSLGRRVAMWFAPAAGSSLLFRAYTGFAADLALAPAKTGRKATSPVMYLLGGLTALAFLIPNQMTGLLSPTRIMIAGVWALALVWLLVKLAHRDGEWRGTSALLPLAAFLVFAGAAAVQSVDVVNSAMSLVIWLTGALLFFLMVNLVRNSRDAAVFLGPILLAACVMAAWSVYQYIYPPLVLEAWTDPTEGELSRSFASMANPNYLAEFCELFLPLSVALWLQLKRNVWRLVVGAEILALALALLLTGSRGGWLAVMVSFALFVLMRFRRYSLLMFAGAAAVATFAPQALTNRLLSAFSPTHSSNVFRIGIWNGVRDMLEVHWPLGTGLGADAFAKVYQEYMWGVARAAHAHNTYLQMLAETGVLGFIAVLWALFAVIRRTSVAGVNSNRPFLLAAVPAALLGLLLHGMVDHIWYNPKLLLAFWAVAGLGMGLALGDREDAAA